MADARLALAIDRMRAFVERRSRRYLWTDAFAVRNGFALARRTGDDAWRTFALDLVRRVHDELGRHRGDDGRTGWLSGLPEDEARAHPTAGGLRIGKALPERRADEPFDPDLEWERDGQYFHYLTKWMLALDEAARITQDARLHLWARELADVAHRRFTALAARGGRMVWKASVDLSRALVPSMGQHDPLDGLVTCRQLDATAKALGLRDPRPDLARAEADFAAMMDPDDLETDDALGLGGLLSDAARLRRIGGDDRLVAAIEDGAEAGLAAFARGRELDAPPSRRLAFRELGLAIGLAETSSPRFARFAPIARAIEATWSAEDSRRTALWREHQDIDDVMLATALTATADSPPMAAPA